jgi:N-acetylneuraminic acid mutarotase
MDTYLSNTEKVYVIISAIFTLVPFEASIGYGSTEISEAQTSENPFWSHGKEMPTPRADAMAAAVDGKIYVIGGADYSEGGAGTLDIVEVYDTENDEWARIAEPLPVPLDHSGAVGYNGKIYVVGGFLQHKIPTDKLFIYDIDKNEWNEGKPLPSARGALTAEIINGTLYAIGGLNSSQIPVNTNEAYDFESDTWTTKAPMPTARHHLSSAVVDGRLYALGGRILGNGVPSEDLDQALSNFNKNEMYDPIADTWTVKQPMQEKRSGFTASALDGQIYVFGGQNVGGIFESVERYSPSSDTWTNIAALPSERQGLVVVQVDKKIYTIGGLIYQPGLVSLNTNEILNVR